jgi:hypothetical protein
MLQSYFLKEKEKMNYILLNNIPDTFLINLFKWISIKNLSVGLTKKNKYFKMTPFHLILKKQILKQLCFRMR